MRTNTWTSEWGRTYDKNWKAESIERLLAEMDRDGKIGDIVVDIGAGAHPVSRGLRRFGRKILEADIAAKETRGSHRYALPVDADRFGDGSIGSKRALLKTARYFETDPRTGQRACVDTMVFSDILNYLDYRRVIARLSNYLKTGGRIVIFNVPSRGFSDLFSAGRAQSTEEMHEFLEENGFALEQATAPPYQDQPVLSVYRKVSTE